MDYCNQKMILSEILETILPYNFTRIQFSLYDNYNNCKKHG